MTTSIIAKRFYHHDQSIRWLRGVIQAHEESIAKLQAECPHVWEFRHQTNAFHATLWNVHWGCSQCSAPKVEKGVPPICPNCLCELQPAGPEDAEAEELRKKVEQDTLASARSFWCPTCNTKSALTLNGD